ncbi:glycosyl transferase family 2 [Kribbella flavida DSM 17836]|uniref:Glycosyl transferase family 2 n=1 Tax=Kribbella flavida (strain DSM 17836 / JCM 10339 / NBRC 14399) TaxID=479435 RepID=D2Q270_KRIFD|nr:glycosyltransferase family 2 protein [Kribbella flavida]ADB34016.1 glycosyl transferase family 2 [Kribbella flavida DSM 17836]
MPTLSLITAVHPLGADFLAETIAQVTEQKLPADWSVEWLVQEDGTDPRLRRHFDGVPAVSFEANNGQYGPALTRNIALTRATGELTGVLDQDDVLLPGALAQLIGHFDVPRIVWAAGQADDLLPDGSRRAYESALPAGVLEPGVVNDWAVEHGGVWPIQFAGLMVRTQALRAVGGWGTGPGHEDNTLFVALSEYCAGYNDPSVLWLYRQHAAQMTQHSGPYRRGDGKVMALQRLHALRHPTAPPLRHEDVSFLEAAPGQKFASGWWHSG